MQKKRALRGFLLELENYDYGVRKIIPDALTSLLAVDQAFGEELEGLLDARDYLEERLQVLRDDPTYASTMDRIQALDEMLRTKRNIILEIVPNFPMWRERRRWKPPRSHWWWYLDQLDDDGHESEQEVVPVPQNRLAVTLDPELAARVGLTVGKRVTVRAQDDRHLIISVRT